MINFRIENVKPGTPNRMTMLVKYAVLNVGLSGLVLLAVRTVSPAQDTWPKFEHLSTAQGLSQSVVNCLLQDSQGFLWMGTQAGLNKYDGYNFTTYLHAESNPSGISGDNIQCLLEDRAGFIWVGTVNGGLSRYNRRTDTFESFTQRTGPLGDPGSLADNTVLTLTQDRVGRVWVGTRRGLQFFNAQTGGFETQELPRADEDRGSGAVTALLEDRAGFLWVGTENGLVRLDRNRQPADVFKHRADQPGSLSNHEVRCLLEGRNGTLYVGTNAGLNAFDPQTHTFRNPAGSDSTPAPLSLDEIYSLADDGRGNLWIGTFGSGLVRLNQATNAVTPFLHAPDEPESLGNDVVLSLCVDRSGLLWMGTYGSGVDKANLRQVRFGKMQRAKNQENTLPGDEVYAVYEERKDLLWLGTDNGLSRYNARTGQFVNFVHDPANPGSLGNNSVYALLKDRRGNLWVGTAGGGLNRMSVQSRRDFGRFDAQSPEPRRLLSNYVLSLLEDRNGNLWIGTNGGLNVMNTQHRVVGAYTHRPRVSTSLSNNEVLCLFQDRQGTVWVGTNGGLNRFDPATRRFTRYQNQKNNARSLPNNTVYCIREDQQGYLWLGTDAGLCRLDPGRNSFTAYTLQDGLPDNVVYGILEDQEGDLWLSTNKGLCRTKRRENPSRLGFTPYNVEGGLPCNAFNIGACHQGASGQLFFGCSEGLVFFYPDSVRGNSYAPPVVLTDFQLFFNPVAIDRGGGTPLTQPISETHRIELSHWQNVLYFEFAALNFIHSERNEYAYRMEGFDDWNYVKQKRNATYTNLDPGHYTFRVKAANSDGVWNERGVAVEIIITPPYYRRPWFYGLGAVAFGFAVAAYVRYRTREMQRNERVLMRKVRERTEEVSRQKEALEATLDHLRTTQGQLMEAEKMASLGLLTAGVAHEINNPINFVSANVAPLQRNIADLLSLLARYDHIVEKAALQDTFAEVAVLKNELDYRLLVDEIHQLLAGIEEGSRRTAEIVKGLRNFSRPDENEKKPVDINQSIESTILVLGSELKDRIRLVKELGEVRQVMGYAGKLNQVFMNIIANAYQAIPDRGEIRIRTFMRHDRVCIAIGDDGKGMTEEVRKRIFEPFFTTKEIGKGTGLGLSISYGIIREHQGSVSVESEPGRGTTFTISLPIC
ncbi:MAG: hypothetical protein H7Z75_21065 [Ferruginibacter sp.]|nr:hypothetical protein [Cytophagales bacterium]